MPLKGNVPHSSSASESDGGFYFDKRAKIWYLSPFFLVCVIPTEGQFYWPKWRDLE